MASDLNNLHYVRSAAEQAWLDTIAGQYVQEKEQHLYDAAVFDLFGLNAVQMGGGAQDLLQNSRIPNRYIASDYATTHHHLHCEDDFLPFAAASIDLLLLPHRLEFSERPHQTLREAERVMMPEGHLIISGFNPISSWGIKFFVQKIYKRYFGKRTDGYPEDMYPWHGQLIRLSRLRDWLALLGFEVVSVEKACHIPPFTNKNLHRRFAWLDSICQSTLRRLGCHRLGGVYFVIAKKRVPGMTLLKPHWNARSLAEGLIPRPRQPKTHENNQVKDQLDP